jgi:hypothetical protein
MFLADCPCICPTSRLLAKDHFSLSGPSAWIASRPHRVRLPPLFGNSRFSSADPGLRGEDSNFRPSIEAKVMVGHFFVGRFRHHRHHESINFLT